MHLSALAPQPDVKADIPYCSHSERTVCSFHDVDIPCWSCPPVVLSHNPPEPEHPSHERLLPLYDGTIFVNPITSANASDFWVGKKMRLDPLQPLRAGCGIVISDGHYLATNIREPGIQRLNLTGNGYFDNVNRQMLFPTRNDMARFSIVGMDDHNNLVGSSFLKNKRSQTALHVLRAAIAWHEDRNAVT